MNNLSQLFHAIETIVIHSLEKLQYLWLRSPKCDSSLVWLEFSCVFLGHQRSHFHHQSDWYGCAARAELLFCKARLWSLFPLPCRHASSKNHTQHQEWGYKGHQVGFWVVARKSLHCSMGRIAFCSSGLCVGCTGLQTWNKQKYEIPPNCTLN